jgi:GAF domain-containing protein/phosphoserine phosphatase RsbU-like protein
VTARGDELARRYATALHTALRDGGEDALTSAYEVGRLAVRTGVGVLDLAAMHNTALVAELEAAGDARATAKAAGEFFLESLSAFEMLERVLRERQEHARAESRQAALLRRLGGFLGDASLAVDAHASLQEVLQLVAEHALDAIGADGCRARLESTDGDASTTLDAAAATDPGHMPDPELDDRLDRLQTTLDPAGGAVRLTADEVAAALPGGRFSWLAAPLTSLDGRSVGSLHVYRAEPDFSELDEAIAVQLAQMASATFERMQAYRR